MTERLFVYGTLSSAHPAIQRRVVGDARLIGRGSISGALYDLGPYPGVVRQSHQAARVSGELYELTGPNTGKRLAAIDDYEGREFQRSRVLVKLRNGRRHLAWAYLLASQPPASARRVASGAYRAGVGRRASPRRVA